MQAALYGPGGFYRTQWPAAHFRTSPSASPLFAEAVRELAASADLQSIVDMGAGDGALLRHLHDLDPDLRLTGVDIRDRPHDLPDPICWRADLPESVTGLVLANEWLDNIPLDLTDGDRRLITVDGDVGGRPQAGDAEWVREWWPSGPAEIGLPRDQAWAGLVGRIERGLAVAVDYGHLREERPQTHTLAGYRAGNRVDPVPDGTCDITADVAVDACLAAGAAVAGTPGRLLRQRKALRSLGIHGARPPISLAHENPPAYLRQLSRAGEAAEITDAYGMGAFWWIVQPVGIPMPPI